ncbi:MAG: phage major capsid protein [Betaproteobacteria bacterium PRO3]|nr:phage major capsid protein [Betaproteobacteria bacterium PRO3]
MTNHSRAAAEITTLGEIFSEFGGREIASAAVRSGATLFDVQREISSRIGRVTFDRAMGLDIPDKYLARYDTGRLLAAMISRGPDSGPELAPFEFEVHQEIQRKVPHIAAQGMFVPWSVLARDFNAGTPSEAGSLVGTSVHGVFTADPLRDQLSLAKLGTMVVPGFRSEFTIPRWATDVGGAFLSEVGTSTESSPATGAVSFSARRFSGYANVSRQAVMQVPNLTEMIGSLLYGKALSSLESGAINGSGSSPNMHGIRSTAGVGSVTGGANGAQLTFAHLADLEAAPGTANAQEGRGGFLVNSATRRWLRAQPKGTGLPYCWEGGERPLLGHEAPVTNNLPSNLTKGTSNGICSSVIFSADWRASLLAIFGAPDLWIDPISRAPAGQIRIGLNIYADFGLLVPSAWAVMDDALTA